MSSRTYDTRNLREVAQRLVDEYGWSALDSRPRVMEWLDTAGQLSPIEQPDHAADDEAADACEARIRWLLEE